MKVFKSIIFDNDEDSSGQIAFANCADQGGDYIQISDGENNIVSFYFIDFQKMMAECLEFFKFLE